MNTPELVKIEIRTHLWQTKSEFGLIFEGEFGQYVSWSANAKTISCAHVPLTHIVDFGMNSYQLSCLTMHRSTSSKLHSINLVAVDSFLS